MTERYYNIHDVVKFKIITDNHFNWRYNNIFGHYQNFESRPITGLDFVVLLGNFKPYTADCQIIENKYFIREDYFYCKHDAYKFTKWSFEISGLEQSGSLIKISSNTLGYLWMCGFIIEFIIHYKLALKGYSILHASGISKDDYGILFSARGGGGKTTLALHFLENHFKLLGDNYVLLHNGKMLSYLTPLNIFYYNLAPIIKNNLRQKQKIDLKLRNLLYKITKHYIKIFKKINIKEICPGSVTGRASVSIIILLMQESVYSKQSLDKLSLCKHLLYNQKLESLLFLPYLVEFSYVFPESTLAKYWTIYYENLIANIPAESKLLLVAVPKQYDSIIIEKITDLIK